MCGWWEVAGGLNSYVYSDDNGRWVPLWAAGGDAGTGGLHFRVHYVYVSADAGRLPGHLKRYYVLASTIRSVAIMCLRFEERIGMGKKDTRPEYKKSIVVTICGLRRERRSIMSEEPTEGRVGVLGVLLRGTSQAAETHVAERCDFIHPCLWVS